MNLRIKEKFKYLKKINKRALVCFITAGDPSKKISEKIHGTVNFVPLLEGTD